MQFVITWFLSIYTNIPVNSFSFSADAILLSGMNYHVPGDILLKLNNLLTYNYYIWSLLNIKTLPTVFSSSFLRALFILWVTTP
jgi:hypothetical protein